MHSKCYDDDTKLCRYIAKSPLINAATYMIQDTQCYCFASNSNKISLLFLSNWIVEFPNFQGQLWQKTISHWIWNFHVKIWRISKWMFCILPLSPAPNAKLKFASVLNSQYKVFLISIYCWSDVLTEKLLVKSFVRNCWSGNF